MCGINLGKTKVIHMGGTTQSGRLEEDMHGK